MLSILSRFFAYSLKPVPIHDWRIVRGDRVHIISGSDKGKEGTILKVNRKFNTVIVEGVNLKVKHQRLIDSLDKGKVKKEYPIHVSKVMLIDPETTKPTKTRDGFLEDGSKVRISKKSGSLIPKPTFPNLTYAERHKNYKLGPKDTPADLALKQTYFGIDKETIKAEFDKWIHEREAEAKWLVFPE